jgi:hypothetical protein
VKKNERIIVIRGESSYDMQDWQVAVIEETRGSLRDKADAGPFLYRSGL